MCQQEKPQSFKDHEFFLPFHDCPVENVIDSRYNNPRHPGINRKHWCLLGDIIQADIFLRPWIVAKDHLGQPFVVAFYSDDEKDMSRILKNFKIGNTIALFYPQQHGFLDGTTGVRVEESDKVLIIPLGFKDVIKMNEQVIAYTPDDDLPRRCHGCDEAKEGLNKCAGCMLFHYCNKDCQAKAWNEKEHKKFCKVLKDKNIQQMLFLKYSTHTRDVTFY
ncbi:hypothetical protein F4821DRAFT_245100 [Hypoxylon rubiginosum]|uniref:Uncharacterized protein n=1 Tax=Hypoxylon rubiginosum TaxID=110542 RepID=A0ACC0CSD8_9PEZI|nr:hypothetical protein F4821DRAFT_245100 [Hypoxylon rubiginosum]